MHIFVSRRCTLSSAASFVFSFCFYSVCVFTFSPRPSPLWHFFPPNGLASAGAFSAALRPHPSSLSRCGPGKNVLQAAKVVDVMDAPREENFGGDFAVAATDA